MPQSLCNLLIHGVFSTKERRPYLRDIGLREEMHRQLGGASKTLGCPPLIVGGVEDHVHILARLAKTITVSDWVKEIKRTTSIWVKKRDSRSADFHWQAKYGAFSVSQSKATQVTDYIRTQKKHHQRFDFKMEFRELLERHGIAYDEKYVWD